MDDRALLHKYDRPGPRYTSYPTAVEFKDSFGSADYLDALVWAAADDQPLSLYVHLPFCAERCWFCACTAIATQRRDVIGRYIDTLLREVDLAVAHLGPGRSVQQLHLGGGTPTWQTPEELKRLVEGIGQRFDVLEDAELGVEADPRVTTREHLEVLRNLGFNRVSFGVQDIDSDVQAAIGREQPWDATVALTRAARELGYGSVNFDLVYGLPHQTPETFAATLRAVEEVRPDRIAIYGFAWVPWARGHQKKLEVAAMPDAPGRDALLQLARAALTAAGYVDIGMDHFALPTDELARAQTERRLKRNFMGYTTQSGTDMIGFGVSAIGFVGGSYVQNHRKLSDWEKDINSGRFPVERGVSLSFDDHVRGMVIRELMCNFSIDRRDVERTYGVSFDAYFVDELMALEDMKADGLLVDDGRVLNVVGIGRRLVRNIAMQFDAYTMKRRSDRPIFSRTV